MVSDLSDLCYPRDLWPIVGHWQLSQWYSNGGTRVRSVPPAKGCETGRKRHNQITFFLYLRNIYLNVLFSTFTCSTGYDKINSINYLFNTFALSHSKTNVYVTIVATAKYHRTSQSKFGHWLSSNIRTISNYFCTHIHTHTPTLTRHKRRRLSSSRMRSAYEWFILTTRTIDVFSCFRCCYTVGNFVCSSWCVE